MLWRNIKATLHNFFWSISNNYRYLSDLVSFGRSQWGLQDGMKSKKSLMHVSFNCSLLVDQKFKNRYFLLLNDKIVPPNRTSSVGWCVYQEFLEIWDRLRVVNNTPREIRLLVRHKRRLLQHIIAPKVQTFLDLLQQLTWNSERMQECKNV